MNGESDEANGSPVNRAMIGGTPSPGVNAWVWKLAFAVLQLLKQFFTGPSRDGRAETVQRIPSAVNRPMLREFYRRDREQRDQAILWSRRRLGGRTAFGFNLLVPPRPFKRTPFLDVGLAIAVPAIWHHGACRLRESLLLKADKNVAVHVEQITETVRGAFDTAWLDNHSPVNRLRSITNSRPIR